jgi:hypothetical protein
MVFCEKLFFIGNQKCFIKFSAGRVSAQFFQIAGVFLNGGGGFFFFVEVCDKELY